MLSENIKAFWYGVGCGVNPPCYFALLAATGGPGFE